MKNLVLGALLVAAASSAACSSSSTDAVVTARWSFATFANPNANGPCPSGFDTASVHAKPWDPVAGAFTGGREVIDTFNCSDLQGTTDPLDGQYLVFVSIDSHDLSQSYATSESKFFDSIDGDAIITLPTIVTDAAYFSATWDLFRGSSTSRLSCSAAGVDTVSLTAVDTSSMTSSDPFPCADGFGISQLIPNGDYTVTLTASLGQTDKGASGPIDATINAPDSTALDHVDISIGQ